MDVVRSAISEAGIQPEQLELEVTESLMIASFEDALAKLNALKDWGIHLSLDDFGTGFSSLTYLRRFPFRTLKIDKSFVAMIEEDVAGAKVIGTIIRMACDNNMNVVAEGVETKEQLAYLKQYGCECIQGYYFSKPIREDDAIELLQKYQKQEAYEVGTYGAWISKNEAYEKAQVTPLEAKRYLNSFLKLAPEATLEKGRLVSESVPEILRKFKFMESSGLKMEEIEQALEKKSCSARRVASRKTETKRTAANDSGGHRDFNGAG